MHRYKHTGNSDFAKSHFKYIRKMLDSIDENVLNYGTTVFEYNFIDRKLHYESGENSAKNRQILKCGGRQSSYSLRNYIDNARKAQRLRHRYRN